MKVFYGLIVCLLFTASLNPHRSWAEGNGAGARGGGTGILCRGDIAPVTIEEFELKKAGIKIDLPSDREGFFAVVSHRLASHPEFLEKVRKLWNKNGAYSSWNFVASTIESLSGAEKNQALVEKELETFFSRAGFDIDNPKNPTLVNDDFADVPAGCEKIQLSMMLVGIPKQVFVGDLSEITQRILELHEVFYFVGMKDYAHQLPRLTRLLVKAVVINDEKVIKERVKAFTQAGARRNTRSYFGEKSLFILASANTFGNVSNDMTRQACPLAISLAYDGEEYLEFNTLQEDEKKGRTFSRLHRPEYVANHSYSWTQQGIPNLFFPEKNTFLPKYSSVFSIFANLGEDGVMYVLKHKLIGDRKPRKKDIGDVYVASMGVSEDDIHCNYIRWKSKTPVNTETVMKIWNGMTISQ
jgi:hypothetical protein